MGHSLFRLDRLRVEHPFLRYVFALLLTFICLSLTVLIAHFTDLGMFQLAVVGVVLSAWYGGLGPGLLSSFLLTLGTAYFLLEPRFSLLVAGLADVLQLGVFVLISAVMSVLSEARYKAEESLRERTAELEAANQELEAFSYSVSHDLRSPLRAIDNHARVALETSPLLDRVEQALQSIRETAQQMGQLVDDLLAFSRLGRQPLKKRRTDPVPLVRLVLEELRDEQEGRSVEISIGELPVCEADPNLLKIIFTNLVHNALKFTRKRDHVCIEVGFQANGDRPVYYVKDNGIGFNMQFTQQLFGIFQRLHRDDDFEGTGVGLAIVQRIIHRHGGQIWAEAELDKGATFYFTLMEEVRNDRTS
jgi:light-regulated signal transduction histidine kinase (bacteriophytochrome)